MSALSTSLFNSIIEFLLSAINHEKEIKIKRRKEKGKEEAKLFICRQCDCAHRTL